MMYNSNWRVSVKAGMQNEMEYGTEHGMTKLVIKRELLMVLCIFIPRCACASEVYGSVIACVCVCVCSQATTAAQG